MVCRILMAVSDFDHLEIVLARAAFRAGPVRGHVLPARARRNAFLGQSRGFVVNESADEAHIGLVDLGLGGSHQSIRIELQAVEEHPRRFCYGLFAVAIVPDSLCDLKDTKGHRPLFQHPVESNSIQSFSRDQPRAPGFPYAWPTCLPLSWYLPRPTRVVARACRPTS